MMWVFCPLAGTGRSFFIALASAWRSFFLVAKKNEPKKMNARAGEA